MKMQRKNKISRAKLIKKFNLPPKINEEEELIHDESPSDLYYRRRVVMAKKKNPEGWLMIIAQGSVLCLGVILIYFSYQYPDHLHFYINWISGHLGHQEAQHVVSQKYLQGIGVEKNEEHAVYWLKKAADQKHPEASYNLAVAHLKGIATNIKNDKEIENLLQVAINQNVSHAEKAYAHWCSQKTCS